ncbi:farnesoate epoxidase-like [Homalodisca vitripennis]|uniref:farnesoate epoxidase-like n=1 Tax=Homalodisca vitripennis TaxID=197043 RepID=UPI001EEA77E5|nr:farnesoate epoxidase-like [Homalodisca vitripennis]
MIAIIVLFILSALLMYIWNQKRPNNFPPGPPPLPIIGNIHQMPRGHFWIGVNKWSEDYGPIIGLSVLNFFIVVITGVDNIVAALRKEEFQARPDNVVTREKMFGKLLGIFFSSGEQWSSSRKFIVKQMGAFGKSEKENLISDEVSRLLDTINDGSIIKGNGMFGLAAINVIWTIVASKRIDFNDKRSIKFLEDLRKLFREGSAGGEMAKAFPIFRFLSKKYKHDLSIRYGIYTFIEETIQEHKETLDPNNPRDIIDSYLIEIERNKNNNPSFFSDEDLIVVASDLFFAGAESTSNSCEFVLLYMILYPEVQRKMQEEIDRVLGRSRKPVLEDKAQMHYTMAVLNEVERINSVSPLALPHSCSKDTTMVVVNEPNYQQACSDALYDGSPQRSRENKQCITTWMHYTMAVLNEVERINSVSPLGLPHSCSKDTTMVVVNEPNYQQVVLFRMHYTMAVLNEVERINSVSPLGLPHSCSKDTTMVVMSLITSKLVLFRMHYTMAVLNEVERINSVSPLGLPHSCSKDTTFGGYFIPKGTTLLLNLKSVGYDPKCWKTPEEFIPERFLNADGQYARPSNMPTFGLGQRSCIGEMLARNTIFLFITTFLEKFSITLPPGEPEPSTMALPGLAVAPSPFKMSIKSRY